MIWPTNSEINFTINAMLDLNNNIYETKENADRKYSGIKEFKKLRRKIILDNKEIFIFLCILFVLINSISWCNV